MRTTQRLSLALGVVVALLFGVMTTPAHAVSSSTQGFSATELAQIFKMHPGAKKIDSNTIEVEPGVILAGPTGSDSGVNAAYCEYKYLCVWQYAYYGGASYRFFNCGTVAMVDFPFPSGGNWSNTISSLVNNQTAGTISYFWDDTNKTIYLGQQHSYGYRDNLSLDSAASGGNWDNRISMIQVC